MLSKKYPSARTFVGSVLFVAVLGLVPGLAVASTHRASVVTPQDLQQAMVDRAALRNADRAAIRGLLERPQVRELAVNAGLDVNRAIDKVGTLSDNDLSTLAARARYLDARIAGGHDDTIVISTTGALLILVVLLLLI
jgi:hypothetical protein